MKLLIVDKTGGVHSGQERTKAVAAANPGEVHLMAPRVWKESGLAVRYPDPPPDTFTSHLGTVGFNGNFARAFYHGGLGGVFRDVRPELVQLLEEPWSFFAWQAIRARRRHAPRTPLLLYTWENIFRDFFYPSRLSAVYAMIERRVHPEAAGMACATPAALDVARRKGFPGRLEVVTYGVDDVFFSAGAARGADRRDRSPVVGFVGRLLEMKGVDTLIEAAAAVGGVSLRILGCGPDEARLRTLVAEVGLHDRAAFLPSIPVEDVPAFMADLDLLVLPSRTRDHWAEQLGRVLPEAMACGTPVIGSDSGCIPWVIGDAGLTFREGNAADLADRIRSALGSDAWRDLSERGRKHALDRFTWRRFAADLTRFHEEFQG